MTDAASLERVRRAFFGVFVPVMFLPTVALVCFGLAFDAAGLLGSLGLGLALLGTGVLLLLVVITFTIMVLDARREHPLFGDTALERAYNWLHVRAWLGCCCSVDVVLAVLFFLVYLSRQSSFSLSGQLVTVAITIPVVLLVSITLRVVFARYLGVIHEGFEPDVRLHGSSLAALSSVLLSRGDVRGTRYLEDSVRVYNQLLHDQFASSPSVDTAIGVLAYLPRHPRSDSHIESQRKLAAALSDLDSLEFVRIPEYCAEFNANFGWAERFEKPKITVPKKGLRGFLSSLPPDALKVIGPVLALIVGLFPALVLQPSARLVYSLIVLIVFSVVPALLSADSMFAILGHFVPPWGLSEIREAAFTTDHREARQGQT